MAADAPVSLGVVAAGALYLWTHWSWLDPVASIAIAVVIVVGTGRLFRQSLHLMFDGVPDSVDLADVRAYLRSQPGVEHVHDLHIWAISTSDIALSVHLLMRADIQVKASSMLLLQSWVRLRIGSRCARQ